ncbi:MAG: insulinase family protein [Bradymonadaceae bacterium]|nr:insulinase family protein [Lujinxingiaceae bacterium]
MELTRYQLDNGLTVLLHPSSTAPVVACNVWVGVGSADEEPFEAGLAHVHEHMLFKGTERRGVGELARDVEAAGGHINAFTSFDQTCYYVVMSSRFFDAGLDILSDAIRRSSFDAEELGRELEVIQEEIKRSEDSPGRVASLKLFQTAYDKHPYRLPVIGTSESVASFGRDDVFNFYKKHYVPANMAVVLVGDFDLAEARQKIDQYFGDFEGAAYTSARRESEPPQGALRAWSEGRDIQQTHFRVGFHIPDAMHEDIAALDLLSAVMGFGEASHLYQTIQRDRELVTDIYSVAYSPKDAGLFMVSADYQLPEDGAHNHEDVVRQVLEETFRFREMRPSEVDLQRARTILESQAIYGKQTIEGLAMKLGHYQMVTGDPLFETKYYEALAKVSARQIQEVARKYLTPDNATLIVLHPDKGPALAENALEAQTRAAFELIAAEAIDAGAIRPDAEGFARVELPDGPTLIVQEARSVATFALRALALGGLRVENPENNGITRMLGSLLTAGTHRRTAVEIAREGESMATSLGGISGRNSLGLALTGLSRSFDASFDLFADCLLNATIPDDEFVRERKLQLQSIKSRQDQLGAVNHEQFCKAFFSPHPYGMPTLGTEATLAALRPEDARQALARTIHPRDLVLVAVGDVTTSEVVERVERYFVRPEGTQAAELRLADPPARTKAELVVSDLEKQQAHVTVGFAAPPLKSSQNYALEVLYAVLSGQGGRLFFELRDRQSLAYSVYADMIPGLDTSAFTLNIGTSPEKIEQALAAMILEVRKLHETAVTTDEIERAKRYLIGNHDIGLQKNSSRAMTFGLDELYGLGYKRTLKYGDYIASVTPDDIQQLVDTYFDLDTMLVSIVKPRATTLSEKLI